MTEESLKYIIDVLKSEKPDGAPDWYEIIGFLICHKTAGLFYCRAARIGLTLPKKAEAVLGEIYRKQKRKVEFMRANIKEISERLLQNNVGHAFLKGSVLSNAAFGAKKLYCDGERVSNDIDLSVNPDGITAVGETLKKLGFVQGRYDYENKKLIEFNRAEILNRRMNRGEVAPYVKLSGNSEFPFVEADVNFSLGNTPQEGKELLKAMLETSKVYAGDAPVRAFTPEMFFIHLILHQYKENCLLFSVRRNKDLDLYKATDIYYMIKNRIADIGAVKDVAEKFGVAEQTGAVLAQISEIFGDSEIADFASGFGGKQPLVVDFESRRRYEWTVGIKDRIKVLDSEKFLSETVPC